MSFLWPEFLWSALLLPALVAVYILVLRRKKKLALHYASLSLVKEALGSGNRIRRHIPPALLLTAIALLVVAVGRPVAVITLPTQQETIILAMDVSGSMRAKDVEPNRLAAAQNAARAFVNEQPRYVRIGVVSFAATASLVQAPTLSREDVLAAIDRFQLQRGTATGSGILVALATLFPDGGFDVSTAIYGREAAIRGTPLDAAPKKERDKADVRPVAPGSYTSAAIILLSDGQRTTGPDPIEAAKRAAERGVRIFTVGIGTVDGEVIGFEGWSFRAQLDEETLRAVANITQAEYFYAGNAADLKKVYQSLHSRVVLQTKETEITAFFAAAGAALAVVAALLSLLWFNRIM
ncbi:MAG TPA: VWA domain-containing protein [Burkholderiaceae bacterium]|nr:VWA domain-containing protein [Burkholderiaceae bacterium]